jgi:hypothetical protein
MRAAEPLDGCPPTGRLVPFLAGAAATLAVITVWAWRRLYRQEQRDA